MNEAWTNIELDNNGNIDSAAPINDKIALIDADTLVFKACLHSSISMPVLPEQAFSNIEEYKFQFKSSYRLEGTVTYPSLILYNYDEEKEICKSIDLSRAYNDFIEMLKKILILTGCRKTILCFTSGKNSFRYAVYPEYKANRKKMDLPAGISELKRLIEDRLKYGNCWEAAVLNVEDKSSYYRILPGLSIDTECIFAKVLNCTLWEADDQVVSMKTSNPAKYILCAVDKDVLNAVEGEHFNYYESAVHNISMKWHTTDPLDDMRWPYIQAVMGDTSDNVVGVAGYGKVKATRLFENCIDGQQMYKKLLDIFGNERKARLNYLLCNMNSLTVKFDAEGWDDDEGEWTLSPGTMLAVKELGGLNWVNACQRLLR